MAATLVAAAGVAALAFAYPHDPVAAWDDEVARWVGRELPAWVEWTARPFSWIGGFVGITVVVVAAAAALLGARRGFDAMLLVASAIAVQLATSAVKAATDRPRPAFEPAVALPSSDAYPSGHASAAVAVFGLLALLEPRRGALVSAVALALAIGSSRIALGVHWTSDVVGGWLLGTAFVLVALLVRSRR